MRKLYQNKQKFENKQRQNAKSQADKAIEAKLNDEQVIKPLEIKPQTQNKTPKTPKTANQQLKKQEKTKKKFEKFEERNTNVVRVRKSNISSLTDLELIMAIRKRDLWRNKHFRESNWQNNATYLQLQDKVTFLRSQLTAEIKAQQQAQQTMIATQQAERQIKKREQELET